MKFLYILLFCFWIGSGVAQKPANVDTKAVDSTFSYLELSSYYYNSNEYKSALDNAQKALDYSKSIRNPQKMAQSYVALGDIYFDLNTFDEAANQYSNCLEIINHLPPSREQAYAYFQLALSQIELKQYDKAEYILKKAQNCYAKLGISDAITLIQLQKGIIHEAKGDFASARLIFNQLIAANKLEDLLKISAESYYHLGTIELKNKQYSLAISYLNKANALAGNDNFRLKAKILMALSKGYEANKNLPIAFKFLRLHMNMDDSIAHLSLKKILPEDLTQFKEKERLKTIEELDKINKQQEKVNRIANFIIILTIAFIFILSLFIYSLSKNNKFHKKSNTLLADKNKQLKLAINKAEKASKARADFLSTVSHELRTPLNAINGITHLLLEEKPKATQLEYLNSLKFSGNYLLTFINDILEINRIDSAGIEIEKLNFNLREHLANLQNSLKETALINNNRFAISIDTEVPTVILGDPTKLSQILLNLINNALKFTKNGEVHVYTSLLSRQENQLQLIFKVSDTGIGIPAEKLDTVFDSFTQGSVEINRKYGGTGLGLSIVKRLTDILGGSISLESQLGKGSAFSVVLPFGLGTELADSPPKFTYDNNVFKGKKILLIEDNKINQMITKKMLENKKMVCEVIDNGEDAIVAVQNHSYDLVLMDVHLPGINGTIATQSIRTFNSQIKIIALTAISLNENRDLLLSFGMNDLITKPFNPEEFYQIICKHLEGEC